MPHDENRAEQRAFAISARPGLGADRAVLSVELSCTFSRRFCIKTLDQVLDLPCCMNRTAKYGPYSQIPPEIPPRGLKTKYDSE